MSCRVEEITEKVLSKLEREYPEGLGKAVDPDFQHALYTVQKQYGRTGDKELGDLLVNLLVDRSKQGKRDILQIVLNESLEVAPKLTNGHVASLTLIFLLRYTMQHGLGGVNGLCSYLDSHVLPLMDDLTWNEGSFRHLEFTGCGTSQLTGVILEDVLLQNYAGFFSNGFGISDLAESGLASDLANFFVVRCLNDPEKLQINVLNSGAMQDAFQSRSVASADREKITQLYNKALMSAKEARIKCVEWRPYMDTIFSVWEDSSMSGFSLTSVGIAIAHANLKRVLGGGFADLAIWVD